MFDGFFKECKTAARTITYVIFCAALLLMFLTQYRGAVSHDLDQAEKGILFDKTPWGGTQNNLLVMPLPEMGNYGARDAENPEQVMQYMTYRLYRDIAGNRYDTYHLGLIRTDTVLKFPKQLELLDIFEKITGSPLEELDEQFYRMDLNKIMVDHPELTQAETKEVQRQYYKQLKYEFDSNQKVTKYFDYENYITIDPDLSYSDFKKYIADARKVIGGQSDVYTDFAQYGSEPYTYEEALALHDTFLEKDQVSGAYARFFCDRMGILAGIFPVIFAWSVAVGGLLRKNRNKPESSLQGSGADNLWPRFFGMTAAAFLPILILALAATVELALRIQSLGLSMNVFSFFSYSIFWLLPTLMFTVAMGLFFHAVTKGSVGVFIQFVIWYVSMLRWTAEGLTPVKYGANMFLRHGIVGAYDTFASSLGIIAANRLGYAAAAIGLIFAAKYFARKYDGHPAMFPLHFRRQS